jgi:hypothetical protein
MTPSSAITKLVPLYGIPSAGIPTRLGPRQLSDTQYKTGCLPMLKSTPCSTTPSRSQINVDAGGLGRPLLTELDEPQANNAPC